ncbi:hypothetical protein [Clavibacter sp. VKM Ac-2542]|uniref:primosomal protein N' family DNA-binding protein n=1 Tax=Clavibacter sp. VKM Ac-2542 TaxID=2783811 RepID=UPI00188B9280|nr:hypothetical protein [Clavibacter sp. VKM Ac-2542]MBF4622588.1 hypothetical protein [Clavibacter sp. VKM Ac-2542]
MTHEVSHPKRHAHRAKKQTEPKTGTRVRVSFGNRESTGTVIGTTITGRYNVKLHILGADEPVTASYTRDELHLSAS